MGFNFPPSPAVGTLYPTPAVAGLPQYRWDGEKWTTQNVPAGKTPIYSDGSVPMAAPLTLQTAPANDNSTKAASTAWVVKAVPLPSLTDFNTVQVAGTYFTNAPDCLNTPSGALQNFWHLEVITNGTVNNYCVQRATVYTGNTTQSQTWMRRLVAGVWGAWDMMLSTAPLTLTAAQQIQARSNIGAAPFDAMGGMGLQINGGFDISQNPGGVWVADMWQFANVGPTAAAARTPNILAAGFPSSLNVTVSGPVASPAAGNYTCVIQRIEGFRIARLMWGTAYAQPITIGFWSGHARPGTYGVTVVNSAANRSYATTYTQAAADTPQWNVITIPGDTSGVWLADSGIGLMLSFGISCGTTYTAPSNNSWLGGYYLVPAGQVNATAATSDVFRMTGLIVLPGTEAPPAARSSYIQRPIEQELTLCQRYFQRYTTVICAQYIATGLNFFTDFPISLMRAAPTVVFSNITYSSANSLALNLAAVNHLRFTAVSTAGALCYANFDFTADARI